MQGSFHLENQVVSHYRVLERIGSGGMSTVYRAEDTRLRRPVALKFLADTLTADEHSRQRFEHEAQAVSALDHPNICTIYEIDSEDPTGTFISMAYYEGESLKDVIGRGRLSIDECVDLAMQLCDGLACAHENGIVHRDVKPENVIITSDGVVKILDFGIAKLAGRTRLTQTGSQVGTALYMAPEQIRGLETDTRADVWAVGVVLFEMLAGETPFNGDYADALFYQILNEEPVSIETLRPDVPLPLASVVRSCLSKDVSARPPDAGDLLRRLKALNGRSTAASKQHVEGSRRSCYAVPAAVVLTLLLAVTLASSGGELLSWVGSGYGGRTVPGARHVAVLPIRSVATDAESIAYSRGMTETITSKLAQLEHVLRGAFWVVPASEMLGQSVESARDARSKFNVNLVVDGSVEMHGDRVRVVLNLIDPTSSRTINSAIIDHSGADRMQVQDASALSILQMLDLGSDDGANTSFVAGGTTVSAANDYYLKARGYLADYQVEGNLDRAVALFNRAVEEDPVFALAHAGLGEAKWRMYRERSTPANLTEALGHARRALILDREAAAVHVTLGNIYTEEGRYQQAADAFRDALAIDPTLADAHRGRAEVFRIQGKVAEAEAAYKMSIAIKPSYWAGYSYLGAFYFGYGRYEEAGDQFARVTELTPENSRGFSQLGAALYAQGETEGAIERFRQSIEIEPSYQAYANLGTLYYYDGRYADAAAMYDSALKVQDTDHRVWSALGESRYFAKKLESYQAAFREALTRVETLILVNSNDSMLLTAKASYHAWLGDKKNALSLLHIVADGDPQAPVAMYYLGVGFEQVGRRSEAIYWLKRAVAKGYLLAEIERNPLLADLRRDATFDVY